MLPQPVTRTEGISVRVIRMLPQLVGLFPVERACMKLDVFFLSSGEVCDENVAGNTENPDSHHSEASIAVTECLKNRLKKKLYSGGVTQFLFF